MNDLSADHRAMKLCPDSGIRMSPYLHEEDDCCEKCIPIRDAIKEAEQAAEARMWKELNRKGACEHPARMWTKPVASWIKAGSLEEYKCESAGKPICEVCDTEERLYKKAVRIAENNFNAVIPTEHKDKWSIRGIIKACVQEAITKAKAEEREWCAKMADSFDDSRYSNTATEIAKTIRRGGGE